MLEPVLLKNDTFDEQILNENKVFSKKEFFSVFLKKTAWSDWEHGVRGGLNWRKKKRTKVICQQ